MSKIYFVLLFLLFYTYCGFSQEFNFTNYNVSNTPQIGPGNNIVNDIIQDKNGNLWFATNSGISKFDGQNWKSYIYESPLGTGQYNSFASIVVDSNFNVFCANWPYGGWFSQLIDNKIQLISNDFAVFDMEVDSLNNILIASSDGLLKYQNGDFHNFTPGHELLLTDVFAIEIDNNNHIWVGTYYGVLYYNGTIWKHFSTENGLIDNYVYFIESDNENNVWMISTMGLSRYDHQTWIHYTEELPIEYYSNFSIDHDNNIFLSTVNNALIKFDGVSFTFISDTIGLSGNSVMSCYEDKDYNLWIGMWAVGVDKYNGNTFTNYSGNSIDVIETLEYYDNKLYIGTLWGGLSIFDRESWETHNISNGFISNSVYDIDIDKDGNIWCGTGWGLSKYDGNIFTDFNIESGMHFEGIIDVFVDNYNNIWIGYGRHGAAMFDGNTWTYYDSTNSPLLSRVEEIFQDKNNVYWFSTIEGNDDTTGKILSWDGEYWLIYQPIEGKVRDIVQDKKGNLWFGYVTSNSDKKIAMFDGINWHTFAIESINENYTNIYDIYDDKDSVIWFGRGIDGCTTFDGTNWKNYTFDTDGFPKSTNRAITQDNDGNMWIGTWETGLYKLSKGTGTIEYQPFNQTNLFTVYPNPASDHLTIQSNKEYITPKTAQLFTLDGKLLKEDLFHFDLKMDIEKLPVGIYILKVQNKHYNFSQKIIKK